ncbi:MAG: hypothetical protein PHG00_13740 [Methylococcales bacterium]|nr:hypothetical protein [Methylococcales bacterium]
MRFLINGITVIFTVLYPLALYFGVNYFAPWKIAGVLAVLLVIKLAASYSDKHWSRPLLIAGVFYFGLVLWNNNFVSLRFYPALVSGVLLIIFSWSLLSPPSLIERFARLQHPDLPAEGVIYTRRVTQVWCIFFIVNGAIAVATAIWSSFEMWSLYNGLIAYVMMGILMGGEYIVRMKTQKHVR